VTIGANNDGRPWTTADPCGRSSGLETQLAAR
jgi:hypothetical protein